MGVEGGCRAKYWPAPLLWIQFVSGPRLSAVRARAARAFKMLGCPFVGAKKRREWGGGEGLTLSLTESSCSSGRLDS